MIDKLAEKNSEKGLTIMHFSIWFLRFFILAVILFVGVLAGQQAVEAFVNNIPNVVLKGLTIAGKFMPAVGFSILLKMLWSKALSIYYILGFILVVYLKLPLVAVAVLGVIMAVIVGTRDLDIFRLQNQRIAQAADEEEDFFK